MKFKLTFLVLLIFVLLLPLHASAERYELKEEGSRAAMAMVLDATILRPLYLSLTGAGTVFFTLTLPITAMAGNIDDAAEHLVRDPARNTFQRCLGCLESRHPN